MHELMDYYSCLLQSIRIREGFHLIDASDEDLRKELDTAKLTVLVRIFDTKLYKCSIPSGFKCLILSHD